MSSENLNFLMFGLWSIGIMGINVYLSHVLDGVRTSTKDYTIHFAADILISATAGVITYLLAKTIAIPDIYLVMVAAVIGHLSARVAYKSILIDMMPTREDREEAETVIQHQDYHSQSFQPPTSIGGSN